jgi:hypothetical protein
MPFIGNLGSESDGMLEIDSGALETIALEVTFLDRGGTGIRQMFTASIPSGATIQFPLAIRRLRPSRVIIGVQPPIGGQANIRIVQAALSFALDTVEDARLVFDVIPPA